MSIAYSLILVQYFLKSICIILVFLEKNSMGIVVPGYLGTMLRHLQNKFWFKVALELEGDPLMSSLSIVTTTTTHYNKLRCQI